MPRAERASASTTTRTDGKRLSVRSGRTSRIMRSTASAGRPSCEPCVIQNAAVLAPPSSATSASIVLSHEKPAARV